MADIPLCPISNSNFYELDISTFAQTVFQTRRIGFVCPQRYDTQPLAVSRLYVDRQIYYTRLDYAFIRNDTSLRGIYVQTNYVKRILFS